MVIRELRQRRRRRQRELQKSNRFILAKEQLCTCITLFFTFFSCRCETTTWKCLMSRFVENVNTRQQLSFSFPEPWYSPLGLNSKKIFQHLTIKRDGISVIKYEAARIHFLCDVFVAVTVIPIQISAQSRNPDSNFRPVPWFRWIFWESLISCILLITNLENFKTQTNPSSRENEVFTLKRWQFCVFHWSMYQKNTISNSVGLIWTP